MKKGQKVWLFKPEKPPKPKVSEKLKIEVEKPEILSNRSWSQPLSNPHLKMMITV